MEGRLIAENKVHNVDLKKSRGEEYVICPVCTPGRKSIHQKEKKLAINIDKRTARCNHCNIAMKFVFEGEYKTPVSQTHLDKIDDMVISFFQKRKISENTLIAAGVKTAVKSIRQKRSGEFKKRNCIAFKFLNNGALEGIKYRDGNKNFAFEKNSKIIPWGMDWIKGDSKECLIVEGEIDRLSYIEGKYLPVISVPVGAQISVEEKKLFELTGELISENPLNLKYIDEVINELDKMEVIYIGTDADAAGIKLRNELVRRLGKERCRYIDYSEYEYRDKKDGLCKCNDGNDVLVNLGPEILLQTISEAHEYKIEDIVTIDDDWANLVKVHEEGYTRGKSTGYPNVDNHFNWMFGHLIGLNGYPNMGKTVFALNLIVLSAMQYGWKWGLYTPENYPTYDAYSLLIEIYLGNTMDKKAQDRINKLQLNQAKEFIREHFEFVNRPAGYSPEDLRLVVQQMILRRGIVGFLTDPWNSLNHNTKGNLDEYLEKELSAEQRFAINHNIIKIINAHPPTPRDKNNITAPSPFQIRGGTIWWAKCYEMLCIHDDAEDLDTVRRLFIQKVKYHKTTGIPTRENFILFDYERRTNRYIQFNDRFNPFKESKTEKEEESQETIAFAEF